MQKEKVYHVYRKDSVIAHNLTYNQLCDKVAKDEIDLKDVDIIQLSPPQYSEASY
jgi:hypothetical protein